MLAKRSLRWAQSIKVRNTLNNTAFRINCDFEMLHKIISHPTNRKGSYVMFFLNNLPVTIKLLLLFTHNLDSFALTLNWGLSENIVAA